MGSGRVPEKVKSERVPEKVGSERVSEMGDQGRYQKNRNLGEYQRRALMSTGRRIGEGVESGRVPENHHIKKG